MQDEDKTREQLIDELIELRRRIAQQEKEQAREKSAAAALRESEERYRQMAENIREVFWMADLEFTRMLYVSPAYEAVWGRTCAGLYANPSSWLQAIHPADRNKVDKAVARWATEECSVEYRVVHPDGSIRWILDRGLPIRNESGAVYRIAGLAEDVTERKRIQDESRKFEFIANASSDFMTLIDRSYRYEAANDAYCKLHQKTRDEILSSTVSDLWGREKFDDVIKARLDGCFAGKEVHDEDWFSFNSHERRCYEISYSPYFDDDGSVSHAVVITRDITERKLGEQGLIEAHKELEWRVQERTAELVRANEALRESEEQFRAVFHTLRDGLLIVDKETGKFIEGNPAVHGMLGYDREELERLGVADIHPEQDLPQVRSQFGELANGAIRVAPEVPVKRKDGSVFYADISTSFPMLIGGKECLIGVFRDITERRRAQEALRNAYRELQDIVEFLPDATFVIDRQRKVVAWNRAMEEMTGVAKQDILGRGDYQYAVAFYGEARPIMIDLVMGDRIQEEDKRYTVLERRGKNIFGEAFVPMTFKEKAAHVWATASALCDVQGNLIGAIESVRDITILKQAEERITKLNYLKERLLGTNSLDEKLKAITDGVIDILGADFARIWIIRKGDLCNENCRHAPFTAGSGVCRDRTRCLHLLASSGRYTGIGGTHCRVPLGCYKVGRVASGEEVSFITNEVTHDHRVHDHEWARGLGLTAFAGYRLLAADGRPMGVLAMFSKQAIGPDEARLLQDLANTASQVILAGMAEEALRESEARYRQLFTTVPDAVYIFDAETRQFIDVNESALNLYGYTREAFLNLKVTDVSAEPELSEATIRKTLATGKRIKIPLRRHRKMDGTLFPVEISGGTFVLSGRRVLVAAVRDISERLRAEGELSRYRERLEELVRERTSELSRANEQLTSLIEEHRRTEKDLREREEFLDAIVENIPDMIFVKDAKDLRYLRFNKAGEEFLGYAGDDLIGRKDHDLFPVHEADAFVAEDREVLRSRRAVDICEQTTETRLMGQRILHTKKIPLLNQDGNLEYLLGISQDITERRHAEVALLKSEQKYRALIETTDTGYLILDSESRVTDANKEYVRLSGHTTLEEILGRRVIEWTAEHDRERNASEVINCLRQGSIRNLEIDYIDKQGRITPVEINATVMTSGQSVQIVSLCRDISDRRRAAEALQASEQRYRQLLGSVTDYMFTIQVKDGVPVSTTHGQGCLAVTGFTPEEYARMPFLWYEMVHPEDQHLVKQHAEAVLRGETRDPLEHRITHKNGTIRWVRNVMVPRHDTTGRMVACDGLISDITERKIVEQELKQTNTYLENVFENSPDAIGIVDASGTFISWNRMAADLYGYTFEEMKGKSGFDLYADNDELRRMLAQMRREGSVKKWEMMMKRKDGTILPFEISIGLLRDSNNRPLGSVAVARDLSGIKEALAAMKASNERLSQEIVERRRAETALLKSEETLKKSQRNLRSLASQLFTIQETERHRISKELHDGLGQDLTVLKIYLATIQNRLKRDQEALKDDCEFLLRRIDDSLENMRRLCRDLSPYLLEELGLEASLKHLFEEVCQRNELRCVLEIEDISPYLPKRESAAVYRIFQETLTNIVKHSGATRVSVSIKRRGEQLSIVIADNGKGFDVREATKRPASKRGMGLFAMEERARMLGGALHILSRAGQGTTISLSLIIKDKGKQ